MAFKSTDKVPECKREYFVTLVKVLKENCTSSEIQKLSGLSAGRIHNVCNGRNPNITYVTAGKIVAGYKKYKETFKGSK